jgi:AcrR family transcriptional regulator
MSKRRTQAERTEASDKAIFKAAISIIAKEGPNNMTLAKVGKAAGFTGGLVSYRFGSKIGLLQAVSERILELWKTNTQNNKKLQDAKGVDKFKLIAEDYLKDVRKRSDLLVAQYRLMQASYGSCPELLPYFKEFDQSIRNDISDFIKASPGIRSDINAEAFAATLLATLRGLTQQYFINQQDIDLEETKLVIWGICDSLLDSSA